MLLVTDAEIVSALGVLLERCKIVPEPAGAAALAPLLTGALTSQPDSNVVVIVCGGNIDRARLKSLL
jgi:threonine dehydratase